MRIPGSAAGNTWVRMTSHWVAPRPYAPSRSDCGTARTASAAVMTTIGSTRTANVTPPAITDEPPVKPRSDCTKTARPSRP